MSTFNGTIDVTIADAKIQTQDFGSKQDPYCVVTLGSSGLRRFLEGETFGKESFQTRVQNEAGQHPVWNESYTLSLKNMKLDSHLKVKLYDKDMINDDFLGVAKIDLSDLLPQDNQGIKYYPLYARGALEMGRSDVIGQVGIGVAFHCTEIPQTQGETKTYATGTVPTYTGETQPTYTDSSYAQAQPVYAQPIPAYAQPAYAQPAHAQAQPAYAQSGDSTKSTGIGGGLLGLITEIADMVIQGPQTVNQPTQDTYQSQDSSQSGTYPQSGTSSTYPQSGTYSQSDAFSQGQKQHDHSGATKRALQFGLLYRGTQNQLEGCINDVNDVKDQFLTQIGFSERDITQVTDDTKIKPTKENMMQLISQLVSQAGDNEVLFLQYSGHGTQVKDTTGDERDGQDEAICPLDFQSSGVLIDDWMFENFVKPLEAKPKTHAFAVIDACHSGTFLDLAYQYVAERFPKPHVKQAGEGRKARKDRSSSAFVLGFSAALDNQTSIDTQEGGIPQGAFTYAFLQVVQEHIQRPRTYRQFLLEVDGILASQGFKCQASLSSSQPIDLDREFREW